MANTRIPGPLGIYSTSIDAGTLARTSMPRPGVVVTNEIKLSAEVEQAKRTLAMDIGQLILDITGIFDPTPASDGVNALISLGRGNWFDAVVSAVSIIPYAGDLAKAAKLPRYIKSVRKAIHIAKIDPKWAKALRELFLKLKQVFSISASTRQVICCPMAFYGGGSDQANILECPNFPILKYPNIALES